MDYLQALKDKRDRLNKAISALEGTEIHGRQAITKASNGRHNGRRRLSAAAKRRISEAAKARWAKAKRAGRNSL
jgi:hypothetical protein